MVSERYRYRSRAKIVGLIQERLENDEVFLLSVALTFSAGDAAASQKPSNWTCGHHFEIEGYTIKLLPDAEVQAEAYGLVGLTRV